MSKCDFCQFKKAYAAFDLHWLGEDDCPLDCPFEYETKYTDAVYDDPSKYAKQTNADRIRAMTDEELAKWLDNNMCVLGHGCPCEKCEQPYKRPCDDAWLEWLKAEVKE